MRMPVFRAVRTKNWQTTDRSGADGFQIPRISLRHPASTRITPCSVLRILRSVSRKIEVRKAKRHGQAHWI